jgi:hypothetical protein
MFSRLVSVHNGKDGGPSVSMLLDLERNYPNVWFQAEVVPGDRISSSGAQKPTKSNESSLAEVTERKISPDAICSPRLVHMVSCTDVKNLQESHRGMLEVKNSHTISVPAPYFIRQL